VAAAMKFGMKGLMENAALTKYTPVNLPSEPLDAVPLLVHAPEVVPPYVTNTRESMLGNKGDARNESASQLTTMKVEDASLFVHVWCVVGLGSIFHGGRICGGRLLRASFLPSLLSLLLSLRSLDLARFLASCQSFLATIHSPSTLEHPQINSLPERSDMTPHPLTPRICHHFVPPTIFFVADSPPRASIRYSAA
jgi:hypothetical protein